MDINIPVPSFFKPKSPSPLDVTERYFRSTGNEVKRGKDELIVKSIIDNQTVVYRFTEELPAKLNVEAELDAVVPKGDRYAICQACQSLFVSPMGRIVRISSYDLSDGPAMDQIEQIELDVVCDLKPAMKAVDAANTDDGSDDPDGPTA